MSTEPNEQDQNESPGTPVPWRLRLAGGPRRAWSWITASRLRMGLASAACLVLLVGLVLGTIAISLSGPAEEPVTLEMALEELDSGHYSEARELAKRLQRQGALPVDELGGPAFVLGVASAYDAESTSGKNATRQYLVAARYLEEARDRGFPPGRRATGLYLLGESLCHSGQIPASRLVLRAALKVNPDKQVEIHRLLADAYLGDSKPELEKALAENTLLWESSAKDRRCLADPRLLGRVRHQSLLQRAQILFRLGRISECKVTLGEIPADAESAAQAMILRGRVLMGDAEALMRRADATAEDQRAAAEQYQTAIDTLRLAQARDTLTTQVTPKAMYLIGVCFLETGDYRAALDQFARTVKQSGNTPEGVAADLQMADLLRQLGKDAAALAAYRRVLAAAADPDKFGAPWLTLDQLRSRISTAYRHYLETQNFEICQQLAEGFYPLFSRQRALEMTVEVDDAWGQALLAQADHMPLSESDGIRKRGRQQFRRAGRIYSRLARLQLATREYPDRLWESANAYFQGQDYANTVRVLRRYLKNEPRRRHPQALMLLGEAMLAQGETDEALKSLLQCIESFPRDAATFRARVSASKAYVEKGKLEEAETLLRENLNGEYLAPASEEWRDSLYALGELLHMEHRSTEAIARLEEAVERYPDDSRAPEARFLAADSYRQPAIATRDEARQEWAGAVPSAQSRQIHQDLNTSLERFRSIEEALSQRQSAGELGPPGELMLRNCHFMIGDVLLDLGQYEAAVKAYSATANRYRDRPEVLLVYVQIAGVYRRLGKPGEARNTLKRAKKVLEGMSTELQFTETTNYNRQEWSELLDSLARL
ncbi:MAG: hypothetical protein A2V70_11995 [Planctomycetes bacterium RBG_13_63_9]|nr:MAG: hypothetical protein A2V70_11995 [Planctomycetes bacterium RBG_13_63_9]